VLVVVVLRWKCCWRHERDAIAHVARMVRIVGVGGGRSVGRSQLVASRDEKRADAANLSSHPRPIISSSATTQSTAAAVVRLRPAGQPAGFHGAGVARSLEGRGGRGVGERSSPRRPAETGGGGVVAAVAWWRRGGGGGVAERAAARLLIQPRNNCTASASPRPHRLAYHRTPL